MNIDEELDAEDFDDDDIEMGNPYLVDQEKGWKLLMNLLPHKAAKRSVERTLLDEHFIDCLHELPLEDPAGLVQRVRRLSDRLMDSEKFQMLQGKALVGLGGQFSAGKSRFINSILGRDSKILLPEDQRSTTAIPTYVVRGDCDEIRAYGNGQEYPLDQDAMNALTHEFYDTYQIALGRFVDYIAVRNANFPKAFADKIAFLDTPGYNKSETATEQDITDKGIAERQLKNVDDLIWLIHANQGTVVTDDLEFLSRIDPAIPKLIVFTHADTKTETNLQSIVEAAQKALDDAGIPYFAVTAYDSLHNCEKLGNHYVRRFLRQAHAGQLSDLRQELQSLLDEIETEFQEVKKQVGQEKGLFGQAVVASRNVRAIGSMTKLYRGSTLRLERLNWDQSLFRSITKMLHQALKMPE